MEAPIFQLGQKQLLHVEWEGCLDMLVECSSEKLAASSHYMPVSSGSVETSSGEKCAD